MAFESLAGRERDQEAMLGVQRGEEAALACLYRAYASLLYSVAVRVAGAADADDVVQETWLQVWRRSGDYSPGRGSVPSWLITIVRSRALDRRRRVDSRRRAERAAAEQSAPPAVAEDLSGLLVQAAHQEAVGRALAELRPEYRVALEVAFFEGLPQTQIAERLDAPLGTVKTWMRRGLLELRKKLKGAGRAP